MKELLLAFIDAVMTRTVAAHEKETECSVEQPCAFCRVNEFLMEEYEKFSK